jgi:hypothetical protein
MMIYIVFETLHKQFASKANIYNDSWGQGNLKFVKLACVINKLILNKQDKSNFDKRNYISQNIYLPLRKVA